MFVAFWDRAGRMRVDCTAIAAARHAPCDHGRFQRAAGFMIAPLAISERAGERKLIGAAVIFAQYLDRQSRWRFPRAIEFSQSSFACSHLLYSPNARRTHAAFQKSPARLGAPASEITTPE